MLIIISQASAKPARLVQDALESRYASITMKEPPTLHHLSRYLNEMIAFCSEVSAGTIPVHKMEDRMVAQFSRIPELATDMVQ